MLVSGCGERPGGASSPALVSASVAFEARMHGRQGALRQHTNTRAHIKPKARRARRRGGACGRDEKGMQGE